MTAEPPQQTAVFVHVDGRQLHLPLRGCELWALHDADQGPVLLLGNGQQSTASNVCDLLAGIFDGLWGYLGVSYVPAGLGAYGILDLDAGVLTAYLADGSYLCSDTSAGMHDPPASGLDLLRDLDPRTVADLLAD